MDRTGDHVAMTRRFGWFIAFGIALVVVAGACIPDGAAVPSSRPIESGTSSALAESGSPSPSGPSARPSFTYPTPTPLPTFLVYTVRSGDTLTSIAREHATTARSIAFWNRQRYPSLDPDSPRYAPNRIEVGWQLLLIPNLELDPEDLPEPWPSVIASAGPSAS
jgi:LysM domain